MYEKLHSYLNDLIGKKLEKMKLVFQMIVLDFEKYGIHCQSFTRVSRNNDILFTTYDYQSWDEKEEINNDERYFFDKYSEDIVNGTVIKVIHNDKNDLTILLDNDVLIEVFVSNGYHHYEEEQEQWRLLIDEERGKSQHIVVYNKHIEMG